MKTLLLTLCLATCYSASALGPEPADRYHIMWTSAKGKAKCCNKKSKEKADHCAEKMRAKGKVTDVKVMAGRCKDM
jgi:hypothetical protein